MKDFKEKVSIIMPAYNESNHIVSSIKEVIKTFEEFGCHWELIIMDDGSDDNTYELAMKFSQNYSKNIFIKKNRFNIGKGRALKKSIRFTSGDYIVFLDADMDLHPRQIKTFFDIMRLDDADVVIGSKLHPNSILDYPAWRRIISWCYYCFVKILFGLPCHDTQTGLKLFKIKVLRKIFPHILVKQFAFDLEVLVLANYLGFSIVEAPVIINNQRFSGRIGLKIIIKTWWDTIAIFYRMHILKYYDNIDYHRRKNMAKEFRRMRK